MALGEYSVGAFPFSCNASWSFSRWTRPPTSADDATNESDDVIFNLYGEPPIERQAVFETTSDCPLARDEPSLSFCNVTFVQSAILNQNENLNLSVIRLENGLLLLEGCTFRDISFYRASPHGIWSYRFARVSATATTFTNISKSASHPQWPDQDPALSPAIGSCIDCVFQHCEFINNTVEGRIVEGGLINIWGATSFLDSMFADNLGIAHFGCGLLFSSHPAAHGVTVNVERCTFLRNLFLPTDPPPTGLHDNLDLTMATVGCFYQTASIVAIVKDSVFVDTVASAIGVFAIQPPSDYNLIDAVPLRVVFNLDNNIFYSSNVTFFGSAAVLRVALNLAEHHSGPVNHSLSITNTRFENNKAPATAIIPPTQRSYFPNTIRTSPSIIQVTNLVGPVTIQNVTFDAGTVLPLDEALSRIPARHVNGPEPNLLFSVSRIHLLNVNSVHLVDIMFGTIPNIGAGGWLRAQSVQHINISNIRTLEFSLLPKSLPKSGTSIGLDPLTGTLDGDDYNDLNLDKLDPRLFESQRTQRPAFITATDSTIQWELFSFEGDVRSTTSTVSLTNILFSNWTYPIPTKLLKLSKYRKLNIKSLEVHNTTVPFALPLIEVEVDALTMRDCKFRQFASLLTADVSTAQLQNLEIEEYTGAIPPLEIEIKASLAVDGLTVRDSTSSILKISGGIDSVTLDNSSFHGVHSASVGGVLIIERTSPIWRATPEVLIRSSTFNASVGSAGGVLGCLTPCNAKVNHSVFFNNSAAAASGGAIFIIDGYLKLENSNFTSNMAAVDGGAIFTSASITIKNTTFEDNSARRLGGAIAFFDPEHSIALIVNTVITNSTFQLNYAMRGGGAISAISLKRPLFIYQCLFVLNRGGYTYERILTYGGAILSTTKVTVYSSRFRLNTARYGGHLALLSLDAFNSFLSLANGDPDAVDTHLAPRLELTDVKLASGTAHQGGGLYALQLQLYDAVWTPNLSMVTFSKCTVSHGAGGAIALVNIEPDLSGALVTIDSCDASTGAGLFISHAREPIKSLPFFTFLDNHASFSGAEIQYGYLDTTPNSTTIANNTANTGNEALWGVEQATTKINLVAVLYPTGIPFGSENSSYTDGHSLYFTYPGAPRLMHIYAKDQFGQMVYSLPDAFDFSLFFNCSSTPEQCDLLELDWIMIAYTTTVQFTFQIAKPHVSALLAEPIYGHLTLVASPKLDIAPNATTRIPITVLRCGAGYGESVRDKSRQTSSGASEDGIAGYSPIQSSLGSSSADFASSSFRSSLASASPSEPTFTPDLPQQPLPGEDTWYTCSLCPRFKYSFNGTCASCAQDSSVESCEANEVISPPTWWVMTDVKTNSYKSFRCAESYCGSGNICLLNRGGTMCGVCQAGMHESITSICVKCSRPNWPLIVLVFCGLWVGVLVLHSMLAVSSGKATILIFFVQTAWSIRLQIPVVSSLGLTLVVRAANWVLCLWPMDFIDRKILFAAVPFIMMAQLCLTFAGYYTYCFIRRALCPSKPNTDDGYQPLASGETLLDALEGDAVIAGAGYGVLSDEDDLSSGVDGFLYESDSGLDEREMQSNPDQLNWSDMDAEKEDAELRPSSNTLSVDASTFEAMQTLESYENVDSILAEETRVWVTQNAYFHHFRLIRTLLGLFANSFSAVLGIIMSTLGCIELLDGSRVLAASPSISCTSSKFLLMRKLYAFFIPWLLIVAGFIFGKLTHSYFKNKLSRIDVRFGVWYEMYKPKLFAWKIVEFVRRALVATIGDLLISERSLRALLLSVVMLLSLAIHLIASPYRHRLENTLESISLFFLGFISLLVLWQSRQIVDSAIPSQLSLALMIFISIVLGAAFGFRPVKAKFIALWKRCGWRLPFSSK